MGFKGFLTVLIFILIIIAVVGITLYFTVFKKENFDNNEDEFEEYIGSDLKYLEDDYDIDDMEYDDTISEDLKEKIKDKKTRSDISSKIKDRINKLPESLEEKLGKQFNINKELGTVITDPYYAPYKSNITRKYTKDELMDSSLLLPGQVSNKLKKEFNLPPEAVKLSNTNLITVNKSVGVNTVGSSLRNASHDIRGDMLVGKSYQGPWNMSTIEADMNNIGLSNI